MRGFATMFAICGLLGTGCGKAPAEKKAAEGHENAPSVVGAGGNVSDESATSVSNREVTVPAGTTLPIILDTAIGSDISRAEQPVRAHVAKTITVDGRSAIPEGSSVTGVVTDATRSGKVKGRAHVAVLFNSIAPRGADEHYQMRTSEVGRTAAATKKDDALKIGVPAAGGALVGGLIGGGKGAAIGAVAGGGAGTAVVLSTRGKEVRLGQGATLSLRLAEPLTVRVLD